MRQVWDAWGHVLTVWACAVPAVLAAIWWTTQWRVRRGQDRNLALRYTVAEAGLVAGTLPWIWMILTPVDGVGAISAVPLRDLVATLTDSPSSAFVQVGANTLLFVPLGFFLPLRLPRFAGVPVMVLVGAAVSATLEIAQYVFDLGRVSSVDDVLMNAAGAGLGALLAKAHVTRRETGRSHSERMLLRLGWST
ncbi:VanZ family protein [Nocardia bhagyanarayanae]|uniref:VanZ like protein n=1 Tax=Nocardia bhagyanarayanae TaxID=1215925 RepID=A0A543FD03_9NOCA|nr:VanZ family protein [Nocardia bhagyanarayanae]TQM31621.1 VanZ like protein [Nocardia bhagyanarayanae]